MKRYPPGSVWPTPSDEDEQGREVYARFGLAMFMAQVLEHGLVNALLVFQFMPRGSGFSDCADWEAAFDRFYDVELGKTFGKLVEAVEQLDQFPDELITRIREAKWQRDYLAHRFFREHDLDILTPPGRSKMIAMCEECIELFQAVDRELEAFSAGQRERFGITQQWVDEHVALMEEEARRRAVAQDCHED